MTKIISLTNAVYEKLKMMKKGRSFSQEIDQLIESVASSKMGNMDELFKYAGIVSKEEGAALQKQIAKDRKNAKSRFFQ